MGENTDVLIGQFDAKIWAEEFVKAVRKKPGIATDTGTMRGWFANAIMAGYDKAKQSKPIKFDNIEVDFSYINLPRERVVELAFLPSGRIVVMTKDESFWFESDGTSPKGSYLTPCPRR